MWNIWEILHLLRENMHVFSVQQINWLTEFYILASDSYQGQKLFLCPDGHGLVKKAF